jgi:3-deoxy-D-arabino-heptulosonate 7-phosphate (DAHP) synthase class II
MMIGMKMRTSDEIQKALAFLDQEIRDNPNHPTNMYISKERQALLLELEEALQREGKNKPA